MSSVLKELALRGEAIKAFPVIDAHAHVTELEGEAAIAARLKRMDRLGIEHVMISSSVALTAEFTRGNDQVAALIRRHPDRFGGYCHVSGNYPGMAQAELERCFATGLFKGIKVYQTGVNFDDPRFGAIWAMARHLKAPVLAHTWGGELTGFDLAAAQCPDIPFLAGHAGSGFAYKPYIEAAQRVPNLYLDLTYSREHTNMIETMVAAVGAHRVVWGSDEPVFSMEHQLGKVLFAEITDLEKELILHKNTAEIFGLEIKKSTKEAT